MRSSRADHRHLRRDLSRRFGSTDMTATSMHAWGDGFLNGNARCFAPTARPKHYRPLRYLHRAPWATSAVINKPRLAACRKRIPEIYCRSQFSTYIPCHQRGPRSSRPASEKLFETRPRGQSQDTMPGYVQLSTHAQGC